MFSSLSSFQSVQWCMLHGWVCVLTSVNLTQERFVFSLTLHPAELTEVLGKGLAEVCCSCSPTKSGGPTQQITSQEGRGQGGWQELLKGVTDVWEGSGGHTKSEGLCGERSSLTRMAAHSRGCSPRDGSCSERNTRWGTLREVGKLGTMDQSL